MVMQEVFKKRKKESLAMWWRDYRDVEDSCYACGSAGDFSQMCESPVTGLLADLTGLLQT